MTKRLPFEISTSVSSFSQLPLSLQAADLQPTSSERKKLTCFFWCFSAAHMNNKPPRHSVSVHANHSKVRLCQFTSLRAHVSGTSQSVSTFISMAVVRWPLCAPTSTTQCEQTLVAQSSQKNSNRRSPCVGHVRGASRILHELRHAVLQQFFRKEIPLFGLGPENLENRSPEFGVETENVNETRQC